MSSTLRFRLIGGATGAVPGLVLLVASLAGNPYSLESNFDTALPTLVLGGMLGWAFALRAANGTTRSALTTAGLITLIAVPAGALAVAVSMTTGALATGHGSDLPAGEVVGGTLGIAVVGLVFLGVPMAGITFAVAGVWAAVIRWAASRRVWRAVDGAE